MWISKRGWKKRLRTTSFRAKARQQKITVDPESAITCHFYLYDFQGERNLACWISKLYLMQKTSIIYLFIYLNTHYTVRITLTYSDLCSDLYSHQWWKDLTFKLHQWRSRQIKMIFFFFFNYFRENSTRDETRQLKTGFTDCKDSKTSAIADCLLKGGNDAINN